MKKKLDLAPLQEMTAADLQLAINNTTIGDRFEEEEMNVVRDAKTGRIKGDEKLIINFSIDSQYSKAASAAAGYPVYVDVEMISVQLPVDPKDSTRVHNMLHVHTAVTDYHIWKYPLDYKKFKDGLQQAETGTPLSSWPLMKPAQVKELNRLHIQTVEQVADMDTRVAVFRPFASFKEQAVLFLEECKEVDRAEALKAQLGQRDTEIDKLRAMVEELSAKVNGTAEAPKKQKVAAVDK